MRKILPVLFVIVMLFSSCLTFEKQSPLTTYEFLEGMPLVLEFERPVVKVDIYDGDKLVYSYNGDIIYELKTNLIFHNDITVKVTEFYNLRQYTNIVKKVEPKIQFLLYVGADNNLSPEGNKDHIDYVNLDIEEIRASIKKSDIPINVIILWDKLVQEDEIIFVSNKNEYAFSTYKLGFDSEISSASTDVLYNFLDKFFIKNNITKKVLDIWDHGNGWAWESKSILSTKAIIQDDTNQNYLKIRDIRNVIEKYNNKYNTKIDVLAFDACNMTSLEIMYEFKDLVDYFIGSVYTIAGEGFYYDFFHNLDDNNLVESFVYNIIDKYNYYYTQVSNLGRLSLVGVNMSTFSEVWNKINDTIEVKSNFALFKRYRPEEYPYNQYHSEPTDMIDVNNLILSTGEDLSNYVTPAIINSVVRIDGIDYHNYSGIGIMFEDIFYNNDNYKDYKALTFYNDFQDWIETTWKSIIKNH